MKNIIVYYSAILLPLLALIYLLDQNYNPGWWMIGLFLSYPLIYRPLIDQWRLKSKGIIVKGSFWTALIPSFHRKYFRALYLP